MIGFGLCSGERREPGKLTGTILDFLFEWRDSALGGPPLDPSALWQF